MTRHPARRRRGEDRLSGREPGSGDVARRGPRSRLDQASRDSRGGPGDAAGRPGGEGRAPRHASHHSRRGRLPDRPASPVPATAKIPIFQITPPPETKPQLTPNAALTPVVVFSPESEFAQPDTEPVSAIRQEVAARRRRSEGRGPGLRRDAPARSAAERRQHRPRGRPARARPGRSQHPPGRGPRPGPPAAARGACRAAATIWVVGEPDPLADAIADLLAGHGS